MSSPAVVAIMHLLDLTLPTIAENLALEEALLAEAEAAGLPDILRLWESPELAVVLGRSSRAADEANLNACARDGVPILRRSSGGCAVVVGPGCLMYSVLLSYREHPELRILDEAHRFALTRVAAALEVLDPPATLAGTSDLAWQGKKFSGNSLRCRRDYLLYHGTLLYRFPLEVIGRYLRTPPREPEYRGGREHDLFVTNLPMDAALLRAALVESFQAETLLPTWPQQRTEQLVAERYRRESWNLER